MPQDQQPQLRDVLITSGFFMVPFTLLIRGMFMLGVTPQYAACLALIGGAILLLLDGKMTFDLKRTLARFKTVCISSGTQIATIASIILSGSGGRIFCHWGEKKWPWELPRGQDDFYY